MNYRRVFLDNGLVFLTIVTQDRCPILVDNINAIKFSYISTLRIYHYRLVAYVVLPTHIHCIIKPREINDYSKIVKSFKYSFTKKVGLVKPTYIFIFNLFKIQFCNFVLVIPIAPIYIIHFFFNKFSKRRI